jgi:hypothetical protein
MGRSAPRTAVTDAARHAREFARSLPRSGRQLLLDGYATWLIDGRARAVPLLRLALQQLGSEREAPILQLACDAALDLWDEEAFDALSALAVATTRPRGASLLLPTSLSNRALSEMRAGRLDAARSVYDDMSAMAQGTGNSEETEHTRAGQAMLGALRGDQRRATSHAIAAVELAGACRLGALADAAAHSLACSRSDKAGTTRRSSISASSWPTPPRGT